MDAARVFAGPRPIVENDRFGHGERRFITLGQLAGRMAVPVWIPNGEARRLISIKESQ